jgi:sigma-54 dependent transcriptional regulator, acetoin dehydrogenase operon transcriptional activator AcoR
MPELSTVGHVALRNSLLAQHGEAIAHSHDRCSRLGVRSAERPDFIPAGRADLDLLRERHLHLFQHAVPVMEMLFEQIQKTHSMVVLTNEHGTILHSLGDDDFLERAAKVALAPGVSWAEESKGTNAVGTALVDRVPTVVHAREHFVKANQFLTCSASPIFDPRGNLLGVLDVSGDYRGYHPHTLGLVKMSARMIENQWLFDNHSEQLRLHFHARPDCIGTLAEGVVAVASDGRMIAANRSALDQLGMSAAQLCMHSVLTIFNCGLGALVDRFRARNGGPESFDLPNGRRVHMRAEGMWGTSIAVFSPVSKPPSALANLDSGDEQMASVIERLRRLMDQDLPILLTGDTGTGKQTIAKALHEDSCRSKGKLLSVNCSAATPELLDAQLNEGAFSWSASSPSALTVFLDNVDELSLAGQGRLLQLIQDQRTKHLSNFALISASQSDLRVMVASDQFRKDLYFHLNGVTIGLPSLQRRSDKNVLAGRILKSIGGQRRLALHQSVSAVFDAYSWPGNLRQLDNVLRTAALLVGEDELIALEHLPEDFLQETQALHAQCEAQSSPFDGLVKRVLPLTKKVTLCAAPTVADSTNITPLPLPSSCSLHDAELVLMQRVLNECSGNVSLAAKQLGISRNTIYRKLHWHGVQAPQKV